VLILLSDFTHHSSIKMKGIAAITEPIIVANNEENIARK